LTSRGSGKPAVAASLTSFFRTTNVTGEMQSPEGVEMVMPGDNARIAVNLDKPVALDIGSHFAIREGGKTDGSGVITEVVE
jgi:elongation factor Tu